MTRYILNDIKKSRLIVIVLWLLYASAYYGRTCYSSAMTVIISNGIYNKTQIGLVGTAFFICYGTGQILSGIIGDKVNPFSMILTGIAGSGICCFFMAVSESVTAMMIIWGINGIAQSMLWAPLLRIFSQTINEKLREKAILNIALSLPIGTVCAYLSSTFIIKHSSWNSIFICAGIIILVAFLLGALCFLYSSKSILKTAATTEKKIKHNGLSFKHLLVSSGLVMILVPSFLHGMMRDGITNWVPTMITEEYGVLPSFSVFLTVILPIFNAFGAYIITPLYKKLKYNEMKTAGICALLALIPMIILMFIDKLHVISAVILLAVTTMLMYSLNYLIVSRVPVKFAKSGYTSTVTGLLNSFAYMGCAVSSYGFGAISQNRGWTAVVIIWIASSVLISIFAFGANKKQEHYLNISKNVM